jgi:hypothetical protein
MTKFYPDTKRGRINNFLLMSLIYKVSANELLAIRNNIFVSKGITALKNNGFERSPFSGELFGKNNLRDYTYSLCRVSSNSSLQCVETHITKGDKWIKIYLNIFVLRPTLKSLEQLKGLDGMQFSLPPNSISKMRLRIDDFKSMPLFRRKEHKIKSFYSESQFQKRIEELSNLIEDDLNNIESFIKRWYELHTPATTDWTGNRLIK